ncbi:zinc finger MYM-type protein 1-like [Acyrthosiphon pisum]|uniref:TTF-type domain-containing protein n=1 Tax=Acyrthosiphon pisum TaxID=7029 RepID=A0A8R2NKV5_ACYPI|nr:zinc finger MYM-type protein 1-like [Acyrthosiphon pisum]
MSQWLKTWLKRSDQPSVLIPNNNEDEPDDPDDPDNDVTSNNGDIEFELADKDSQPHQPLLVSFPKKLFGKQNRSFSSKYYKDYTWIEYSQNKDLVFCFYCRNFGTSSNSEEVFTKSGFKDWKKISEKLNKHSKSSYHLFSLAKYKDYQNTKKTGNVHVQMSNAYKEEVEKNRKYMLMIIDAVLFLAHQGLSFRGHTENKESLNQGNFKEICGMLATYNPSFASKMETSYFNYTCPLVQNDLISITAGLVRSQIVQEITECGMYALMCDEARSFKEEQLTICVRYTKHMVVQERFLSFVLCSTSRSAAGISNTILESLKTLNIDQVPMIGQSYDGASVMAGHINGVQKKIREFHPEAIFFYCVAHKLNLVIVGMCKHVKSSVLFFNTLESLYIHFSRPSSHHKLINIQKQLGIKPREIMQISDTRWACRFENCDMILHPIQKNKRKVFENSLLKDSIVTSTVGTDNFEEQSKTPEAHWRSHSYYEILDSIIQGLNSRFSSESLSIANALDTFLKLNTNDSDPFINHYQKLLKIDSDLLKAEMIVAKNCILKEEWDFDELINIANKSVLPNLRKMLKVALILPVITATCERSFSAMRRIKTWLRSRMEQNRFDNLAILNIAKDLLKNLNKEKILDEFAKKPRKLKL